MAVVSNRIKGRVEQYRRDMLKEKCSIMVQNCLLRRQGYLEINSKSNLFIGFGKLNEI